MEKIYCAGESGALIYAKAALESTGVEFARTPGAEVTHLLLPVPSLDDAGQIRGGGDPGRLLAQLPPQVHIIGGNLDHPVLSGYRRTDLLKLPYYIAKNAAITAHCAVRMAMDRLLCTLEGCPVLVIGWGRIGKCLARLLRANDASVTVYARKETDRALLNALGYETQDIPNPTGFRAVINTAPAALLPDCPSEVFKMELSSVMGLGGRDVLWAKGLPAIHAPESSGKLIADSIYRLLEKEEPL